MKNKVLQKRTLLIILLILLVFTMILLIKQKNVLNKTSSSNEKAMVSQYEQELKLCVEEIKSETEVDLTLNRITECLAGKANKLYQTKDISVELNEELLEISGVYKGYNYTIDNSFDVAVDGPTTESYVTIEIKKPEEITGYTNQNEDILIVIKNPNGIKQIVKEDGNILKLNGEKEWSIDYARIDKNTIYSYEIEDINGNKEKKTAFLGNIDKLPPKSFNITAEATNNSLKIVSNVQDEEKTEEYSCSGIEKHKYYVKRNDEEEYVEYDTAEINLSKGTYSVYAVAYDRAGNSTTSNTLENIMVAQTYNNVDAATIKSDPGKYYGMKVNGYTSENGQNDWKVFYSNGTNIFLITGDYIEYSKVDFEKTKMERAGSDIYGLKWQSEVTMQNIDETTKTLFKTNGYDISNSNYLNSAIASTLLNKENWKSFLDNENAIEAVGSPTIEMWLDSWNDKYPDETIPECETDKYGYGWKTNGGSEYWKDLTGKKGYKNTTLYFLKKENVVKNTTSGYWISSPSYAFSGLYSIIINQGGIYISHGNSSGSYISSLRPVVCLKEGTTLNLTEIE